MSKKENFTKDMLVSGEHVVKLRNGDVCFLGIGL